MPVLDVKNNVFYFTSDRMEAPEGQFSTIEDLKSYANSIQNGMGNIYRMNWDEVNEN